MSWAMRACQTKDSVMVRLGVWDVEDAKAQCMLFLGRGDFLEMRAPVAQTLARSRIRTLAWDWRGQGGSQRAPTVDVGIGHVRDWRDYGLDVDVAQSCLVPHLPTFALAHSMGGLIAMEHACHRQPSFGALVALSPMLGFGQREPEKVIRALSVAACALGYGTNAAWGEAAHSPDSWRYEGNMSTDDQEQFAWLRRVAMAHPELCVTGSSWGWVREATAAMARLRSARDSLMAPTLLVSASGDRSISLQAHTAFVARQKDAHFRSLPGAHDLLLGAPSVQETLWHIIFEFLQEHLMLTQH